MKKILFVIAALSLALSCAKDPEVPKEIIVTSVTISASAKDITSTSVTITGTCSALSKMSSVKAYCGTVNPPSTSIDITTSGDSFKAYVNGLSINTTYYFYAEATGGGHTYKSEIGSFKTEPLSAPKVSTKAAYEIGSLSAKSGGNITDDGGSEVTARGVVWSTSHNPTVDLSTKTSDGTGKGEFVSSITGLEASTLYYVRAYAVNSIGTTYGEEKTFTTSEKGTSGDNEDVNTDDKHKW